MPFVHGEHMKKAHRVKYFGDYINKSAKGRVPKKNGGKCDLFVFTPNFRHARYFK